MSSSLIVEICQIGKVEPHPNADKMAVAEIKGWKTCIKRGEDGSTQFKAGDACIFFPPDCVLPHSLSEKLGVTKYLKKVARKGCDEPETGRVSVSRLRGQQSYGFVSGLEILAKKRPDGEVWQIGDDVAATLGITKWEPPMTCTDGDAESPHPAFHRYCDIENLRNFPEVLQDGEEVVFTEKMHGMNCRVGLIREADAEGKPVMTWMAGSHDVRRKEFVIKQRKVFEKEKQEYSTEEIKVKPRFWQALDKPGVRAMIEAISQGEHNVVVFGEIFGSGIQDMAYGMANGVWDFRVFDIAVNGSYLSVGDKVRWCHMFAVATVPFLFDGAYSEKKVEEYVGGPTTYCDPSNAGAFKGREGIVITPRRERTAVTDRKVLSRVIFKAINFEYLERRGGTEFH